MGLLEKAHQRKKIQKTDGIAKTSTIGEDKLKTPGFHEKVKQRKQMLDKIDEMRETSKIKGHIEDRPKTSDLPVKVKQGEIIPKYLLLIRFLLIPEDLAYYIRPSIYRDFETQTIVIHNKRISYMALLSLVNLKENQAIKFVEKGNCFEANIYKDVELKDA